LGDSEEGVGVFGRSRNAIGVWGRSRQRTAVRAEAQTEEGTGIWATGGVGASDRSGYAGFFEGRVHVDGDFEVTGSKGFKIDHPLDPDNRYLNHFSVESPDTKTIYDGTSYLDEGGAAVVELPEWFEALNSDFRYQLTPIGAAAPALHIAEEVSNNRFRIGGGAPRMKVSWQVTGARKDIAARSDPITVEEEKPAKERDRHLTPEPNDDAMSS
jgi:hypothetical protein